jgi:hypothetical protein
MMLTCAVDRIEENVAVLIADDGTVHEVRAAVLGATAREGAVLRVPLADGTPQWALAERDRAEEASRLKAAQARLKQLRRDDPGGDLSL